MTKVENAGDVVDMQSATTEERWSWSRLTGLQLAAAAFLLGAVTLAAFAAVQISEPSAVIQRMQISPEVLIVDRSSAIRTKPLVEHYFNIKPLPIRHPLTAGALLFAATLVITYLARYLKSRRSPLQFLLVLGGWGLAGAGAFIVGFMALQVLLPMDRNHKQNFGKAFAEVPIDGHWEVIHRPEATGPRLWVERYAEAQLAVISAARAQRPLNDQEDGLVRSVITEFADHPDRYRVSNQIAYAMETSAYGRPVSTLARTYFDDAAASSATRRMVAKALAALTLFLVLAAVWRHWTGAWHASHRGPGT